MRWPRVTRSHPSVRGLPDCARMPADLYSRALMKDPFLLWQLADSAFPSGGFAHSGGLESAAKWGLVRDRASFVAFLHSALCAVKRGQLPFVNTAVNEPETFEKIDRQCNAFLQSHVANRGSRRQGRAFLSSSAKIFSSAPIRSLAKSTRTLDLPGHFAPAFGAVCGLLGIEACDARRLYIFVNLRGLVSSAVRLGIVGPIEGQGIQNELGTACAKMAEAFGEVPLEAAVQSSPVVEILQATHDRMYSKLFQS